MTFSGRIPLYLDRNIAIQILHGDIEDRLTCSQTLKLSVCSEIKLSSTQVFELLRPLSLLWPLKNNVVDQPIAFVNQWMTDEDIVGSIGIGGSRNLERGVQSPAREARWKGYHAQFRSRERIHTI